MSEAATDPTPTAESPAFLQAIVELGKTSAVVTSQPIFNGQGVMLLEGGARVDQGLYDRLLSHRLSRPLDECVDAEPPVGAEALRDAALAAIERWPFFARMAPPGPVRESLLTALAGVPLPKPIALHLAVARDTRPALFAHGILMALLCAYLARQGGATPAATRDAAAAGLLHDLGMLHIDSALLDVDERLSSERLKPVYVHPLTASILISRFAAYPKSIVRAIVEHHERLDGSGYPRGLQGDAISRLGRILSLAEVVTAMFDGARAAPELRLSVLLRVDPRRYDASLVTAVHRLLAGAGSTDASLAEAAASAPAAQSIEQLLRLAEQLARWRRMQARLSGELDAAHAALLHSVDSQNATLQRMLHEAGVTPEQLVALGDGLDDDVAVRLELWALGEELLWQLHAAANQLERRWAAAVPALPLPAALIEWLGEVGSLDVPAATV
ncbi:MAG: HD domain-containing protein [Pseudomonadota bacterium]|nr:HD domain-containing protein [Pseudomonadota bacterium]